MVIIYFISGLAFGGLGLAAYLQLRREAEFPLKNQLPWLAAFALACASVSWIDMFLASGTMHEYEPIFTFVRMLLQPLTGLLLLKFGWGILQLLSPLPAWTIFIPGLLIVPIAYVLAYASTTFITPSPIAIPIDIWSRYLLYLPGSILAGIGFLRQWRLQRAVQDISKLMLGAGLAFLFEAFVVGLVVPAAPYGPASYYNYDRVVSNAFSGESATQIEAFGLLMSWLDYDQVLETTGLPIQFWRMLSALAVTFFVVRCLDVFDALQKRHVRALQEERDRANRAAFQAQITARKTAESWTDALVKISRQITQLENVDSILAYIVSSARSLLRCDFAGLAILEDQNELVLKCYASQHGAALVEPKTLVESPLILRTMRAAQSVRLGAGEVADDKLEKVCFGLSGPANAVAIIPLNLDNRPIGALWIANAGQETFSETDLVWLECLADQIVITIQHALMTSRIQTLSVVEERARIAREMHDGLAQVLGYLNLQVQTLGVLYEQGRSQALREELNQMRQAIKTAHADVRENILSLRTTLASQKGMVPAIQEYLQEFSIQTRLDIEFTNQLEQEVNLSSIAEVQLVCILQEALTNVRKHAQAKKVNINLKNLAIDGAEYVSIEVVDDGVGFKQKDSERSFGLQTMRERALGVDGRIDIQSWPGKGTRVVCQLPCLKERKGAPSLVIA